MGIRLVTEGVVADGGYHRAAENPLACGGFGIVIINCAAAWVESVECVAGGTVRAVGYRLVELPVVKTGKSAPLINHAR